MNAKFLGTTCGLLKIELDFIVLKNRNDFGNDYLEQLGEGFLERLNSIVGELDPDAFLVETDFAGVVARLIRRLHIEVKQNALSVLGCGQNELVGLSADCRHILFAVEELIAVLVNRCAFFVVNVDRHVDIIVAVKAEGQKLQYLVRNVAAL